MKRFFLVILLALLAAAGVWYGLRLAEKKSAAAVTSLLPKETLFFAHVPDLKAAREQWHSTDLYQLWREPDIQEFLRKPLDKIPKRTAAAQDLAELEQLEPTDLFFGVTAWSDGPKVVGGFRFKGTEQDAEKIVGSWRANLERQLPEAKHETLVYEQHQIQSLSSPRQTFATVYDGNWLFAANDVDELKAVLDRADQRSKDRAVTLTDDETFADASRQMPKDYAALVYARADRALEKIAPLLAASAPANNEPPPLYRQMHAICGTLSFDHGKIRDVFFVGMPKLVDAGALTRASLALGTKDTFLYLASFLNIAHSFDWPASPSSASPLGAGGAAVGQRLLSVFSASGISLVEWDAAFAPELGLLGDWPTNARLPSLLATVPVKDATKANQLMAKLIANTGDALWTQQEKDGVRYFSMQPAGFLSFAPTFALSKRMLTAGSSSDAVAAAMQREAREKSELAASETFRDAERMVPTAHEAFAYLDLKLLYTRLDTALRPMLLMAAAFVPSVNENLDVSKWPPAEVVTKHLSPIVMSQSYRKDGYVTDSVGPIAADQAAIVALLFAGAAAFLHQNPGSLQAMPSMNAPAPTPTVSPIIFLPPAPKTGP